MVTVRFVLFCADTVNDFMRKNCPYIAGAIAFYALFAMFPLFLAVITVLGYLAGLRTEAQRLELAQGIADVLPVSSEFVSTQVQGVVNTPAITGIGIASVFGLLWASTAAFGAIRKGINAAWGVKKTRPFLEERLIDIALVLGAGVVLLAVLYSGAAISVSRGVLDALAPESQVLNDSIWRVVSTLFAPVASFAAFVVMYRFLPNTDVRLGDVWLGALLASLAFETVKWGFVKYVTTSLDYNVVYGSVGAVVALLTWVYVSAIIVLFGALITSRYAAYASSIEERETYSLKLLWTGFSRVSLRVVESTRTG